MTTTRNRVKPPVVPVIKSKDEADAKIARIAELQNSLAVIQQVTKQSVDQLVENARQESEPLQKEIDRLAEAIASYAAHHRDELTNHGKTKLVKLVNGVIKWRLTPLKAVLRDAEEVIIDRLKKLDLERFIVVKESIDKNALKKERAVTETVDGVSFSQQEEFIITPNETKLDVPSKFKVPEKKAAS